MKKVFEGLPRLAVSASALLALLPVSSNAAIMIDVAQVGPDVIATASGSVNVSALTNPFAFQVSASVFPSQGVLVVGSISTTSVTWYQGATGPSSMGSGGSAVNASSGAGQSIGVLGGSSILLPTSLTPTLSGSATFAGTTLSQLGLSVGTYTWTWGSGLNADSLTISVVPEPHQYAAVAGLCLVGVGLWRRHARR
jgi:hypothetical protein